MSSISIITVKITHRHIHRLEIFLRSLVLKIGYNHKENNNNIPASPNATPIVTNWLCAFRYNLGDISG